MPVFSQYLISEIVPFVSFSYQRFGWYPQDSQPGLSLDIALLLCAQSVNHTLTKTAQEHRDFNFFARPAKS